MRGSRATARSSSSEACRRLRSGRSRLLRVGSESRRRAGLPAKRRQGGGPPWLRASAPWLSNHSRISMDPESAAYISGVLAKRSTRFRSAERERARTPARSPQTMAAEKRCSCSSGAPRSRRTHSAARCGRARALWANVRPSRSRAWRSMPRRKPIARIGSSSSTARMTWSRVVTCASDAKSTVKLSYWNGTHTRRSEESALPIIATTISTRINAGMTSIAGPDTTGGGGNDGDGGRCGGGRCGGGQCGGGRCTAVRYGSGRGSIGVGLLRRPHGRKSAERTEIHRFAAHHQRGRWLILGSWHAAPGILHVIVLGRRHEAANRMPYARRTRTTRERS